MNIPFPISIALVGAPGSGKQALAEEFQKISADYFAEHKTCTCDDNSGCTSCGLQVIQNSGNYLQETMNTPMGVFGGYAEDIRAFFLQYEAEQEARLTGASYITLGTTLENIAHAVVNLETILTGVQSPDTVRRAQQGQIAFALLTSLFDERFRYTFGFYVPSPQNGIVLPGTDDSERQYNQRVDMALRTALVNFGIRIQALDQPTIEEKAQEMFETVKRIVENGPEVPPAAEPSSEEETVPPEAEPTLAE